MKSRIYKPVLRIFLLLYVALSACASLFCSLYVFALCVFALFFCICHSFFSLPPPPFFFTCACLSLFIERFQRNYSLFFSQLIRSWSSFRQFFSSTTPNFTFSRDPLFSLFLYSLFCCLLNSFSVCDSPLSPNRVPHFLMVIFLYSLFSISIILLLHLLLPVAIFNSLSLFFLFYFIFIYLGTIVDLLLVNAMPTFPYFSHSFPIGNRGLAD